MKNKSLRNNLYQIMNLYSKVVKKNKCITINLKNYQKLMMRAVSKVLSTELFLIVIQNFIIIWYPHLT